MLEPSYAAFVKVLGTDVVAGLKPHGQFKDTFVWNGRPIRNVHLVGAIVSVRQRPKFNEYILDDGTGLVTCIHWIKQETPEAVGTMDIGTAATAGSGSIKTLQHGSIASVRGHLTVYNEQRQVAVDFIASVDDPNAQMLHWLEAT